VPVSAPAQAETAISPEVPAGQWDSPVPHARIEEVVEDQEEGDDDEDDEQEGMDFEEEGDDDDDDEEDEEDMTFDTEYAAERDPTHLQSSTAHGTLTATSLLCQPVSDTVWAQFAPPPTASAGFPTSSSFTGVRVAAPVYWT